MTTALWSAIALSADIEPGTAAGARLAGRELVVWRDAAGEAHVFDDRCPHRGMKLSFGFVRGNEIACLYHGWRYDRAGLCRAIPAHPDLDVPATIRVARYTVSERLGLVWVSLSEEEPPPPVLSPDRLVTPLRSLFVECDAKAVRAALIAAGGSVDDAGLWRLSVAGCPLLIALRDCGGGRSALQCLIDQRPDHLPLEARHAVVRWTSAFRDALEGSAVSASEPVP
jgi:nitrite reductase/ring-hydroxylating ferredoxin subunit